MNILSMLTIVIATIIVVTTLNNIKEEYNQRIKLWLWMVEFSLGLWCFCYFFFYVAPDKETALFWHRFSSVGWSTFAAFTAMYFIVYTGHEKKYSAIWKRIAFFIIPFILVIRNLFGTGTCVAIDLVQSTSGLGWTYIGNIKSPWYWIFIIQMLGYFSLAFIELIKYNKRAKYKLKKEMAISLVILDSTALCIGLMTDLVFPYFTHFLPPMSVLAIGVFQIGYLVFVYHYDIYNIDNVISSRDILENSMHPIILLDNTGEILRCNSAVSRVFGYEKKYIIGKNFNQFLVAGKYRDEIIQNLFKEKEQHNIETKVVDNNGDIKNVIISATVTEDKRKDFKGIVVSLYDVTEMLQIQEKLQESNEKFRELTDELYLLSYNDQLTQLPNRRKFYSVLEEYRKNYIEGKLDFAVIYMDLDGFKKVNDTYGHEIGDQVLVISAQKINRAIEGKCFVARMGGDEFVCVVSGADIESRAQKIMELIKKEFEQVIEVEKKLCDIEISLGCSIYNGTDKLDELIKKADDAMYYQKSRR